MFWITWRRYLFLLHHRDSLFGFFCLFENTASILCCCTKLVSCCNLLLFVFFVARSTMFPLAASLPHSFVVFVFIIRPTVWSFSCVCVSLWVDAPLFFQFLFGARCFSFCYHTHGLFFPFINQQNSLLWWFLFQLTFTLFFLYFRFVIITCACLKKIFCVVISSPKTRKPKKLPQQDMNTATDFSSDWAQNDELLEILFVMIMSTHHQFTSKIQCSFTSSFLTF